MTEPLATFALDGEDLPFNAGQTILQAATRGGRYIPHLCWHPDFAAHGSCRLCIVEVDGRTVAACTTRVAQGMEVQSRSEELNAHRKTLLQMLFVEGNHFCPSCEKSGNCRLQATPYDIGMHGPRFEEFYPDRPVDASHPDILLDLNRCILCELCVRASRDIDGKSVFAIGGHGIGTHLLVNSPGGRLAETGMALGTPAYMSPEQVAGDRDLDGRSDQYALACVLFEMLAGQPPFTGRTGRGILNQHLAAEPPSITGVRAGVPPQVAAALQRALSKSPSDRFATSIR